jgi:cold shock CspA family protein
MNQQIEKGRDTYTDTWAEDEDGKKYVFTVSMKRKLARAGLPIEAESLSELKDTPSPAKSSPPERKRKEFTQPDIIQIDPETGKYIGRLKWYNPVRGYGFIARGAGEDIFFHKTSTIGNPDEFEEGQWVLYDVEDRPKGPEAAEVEPYLGEIPEDSGEIPEDPGDVPEDSGEAPEDSGEVPEDSGEVPEDSGEVREDSGEDE